MWKISQKTENHLSLSHNKDNFSLLMSLCPSLFFFIFYHQFKKEGSLRRVYHQSMEFHLEHPLSHSSLHNNFNDDADDETLPHSDLFLVEFQHMPSSHYFHSLKSSAFLLSNRNQAISSITQVFLTKIIFWV